MEVISKLGIGPMSSEVIEAAFRLSEDSRTPLMLIASKNQIDWDGGYVNDWDTRRYADYLSSMSLRYPKAQIYICRDHCGPGFKNADLPDVYQTIRSDIENGFDLIHVDFCRYSRDYLEVLEASKKAIEYISQIDPYMLVEVGTDENNGTDFRDIRVVAEQIRYFREFCDPHFFVCQTGSLIKEMGQYGIFLEGYVKDLKDLVSEHGLVLKEHNADYLTEDELTKRKGLISALNVAPQFGVLQTQLTLTKCLLYGINPADFLEESYSSRRWEKWLYKSRPDDKYLCAVIAGHYNFSRQSYQILCDRIQRHEDFREIVIQEVMKLLEMYLGVMEDG